MGNMSNRAVNGLDESASVNSVCLMKILYFQSQCSLGGFDSAHDTRALSALCLMKAPKLCLRPKKNNL